MDIHQQILEPANDREFELSPENAIEAEREIIRQSVDAIASDVAMAMRDAGLHHYPIGVAVPNSGNSVASILCPVDPPDDDWSHITAIVCAVLAKKLGGKSFRGLPLVCAMTTAAVGVAEIRS
jgi:hypothetical protein